MVYNAFMKRKNCVKKVHDEYKHIIMYLFFGALTTVINLFVYSLCYYLLEISNNLSNITAWLISVLFAYVSNKLFVFSNGYLGLKETLKEVLLFFTSRIATGVIEFVIMYMAVDILGFPAWKIKIISNIIVITVNYLCSKFYIFVKEGRVDYEK